MVNSVIFSIVRGTRNQNDTRFNTSSRNHQCTANAIVALAYSELLHFSTWSSSIVNNILDYGDGLYLRSIAVRDSSVINDPNLTVVEVYSKFVIDNVSFNLNILEVESIDGRVNLETNGPFYKIVDGLRLIFQNYRSAILTCQLLSTCVSKSSTTYYVFDSHSRDSEGKYVEYDGKACLLCFQNFNMLIKYLLLNYDREAQYSLIPINVEIGSVQNLTNTSEYVRLFVYETVSSSTFQSVSVNNPPVPVSIRADESVDFLHYLGKMDRVCPHCEALFFQGEIMRCCSEGKVSIPINYNYPDLLKSLITDMHPLSKCFLKNIRRYNTLLSLGSTTSTLRTDIGVGAPVVVISGQIYHRVGNVNARDPKFGSLYFIDSGEAKRRRSMNTVNDGCNQKLLEQLDALLRDTHPYAKLYRSLGQVVKDAKRDNLNVPQLGLYFHTQPGTNRKIYAAPTTSEEIGAVFKSVDGDIPPPGQIRIFYRDNDNKTIDIPKLSPIVDTLCYPILFPRGELGWSIGLMNSVGNKCISKREFECYRIMCRRDKLNPIIMCGTLYQHFITDKDAELEGHRLYFLRTHQKELRADSYVGFQDFVARKLASVLNGNEKTGRAVILPSTHVGSPRYMQQNYQDAMAIVAKFGRPSLFVTFTCNPNWREIKENLGSKLLNAQDRPELIARIFDLKRRAFFDDILKKNIFGKVKAFVYVIEFQKRGLPHMHCLITLADEDKLREPEDVDKFICAELPDENTRLFKIIMASMIHGPCGNRGPNSACMEDGVCSKQYPKSFAEKTIFDGKKPVYRRRNDGRNVTFTKNRICFQVDNRDVVPYNPYLCSKYESHINVEAITSVSVIKYAFKYINKGPDAAIMELKDEFVFDEIKAYIDSRYISSGEAAWTLLALPKQGKSHTIFRLPVHLPGEKTVYFSENDAELALQAQQRSKLSILEAFFELNKNDPRARKFKYCEIPIHFTFDSRHSRWSFRQRKSSVIPRMYTISPKYVEKFHLRVLLLHVTGPTSFEDLRTYNGITYSTFQEAARERLLISSDAEWEKTLEHAALVDMPNCMRKMFAYLLCYCEVSNPLALWNAFKTFMCEDFRRRGYSECQSENKALRRIEAILLHLGKNLKDFNLPNVPSNMDDLVLDVDYVQPDSENLNPDELNSEQRVVFDRIVRALTSDDTGRYFYLQGSGGTGKTHLYNTILDFCNIWHIPSIAVAFTGIAALLLKNGRTVHSTFRLPLDLDADSRSSITAQSQEAAILRNLRIIIWDEVSMVSYHVINAVDRLLQDVCDNNRPFGGKCILLGGDVKQLLPVASGRVRQVELFFTNCNSWDHFQVLELKTNMRTDVGEDEFTKWLEHLGTGTTNECRKDLPTDSVSLPVRCLTTDIIGEIYERLDMTAEELATRAILCPKNENCNMLNNRILLNFPGNLITILSSDTVASGDEDELANFPEEYLNSITPSGMPHHELKIKVGVPVILLRNLSLNDGLINGTRLLVLNVTDVLLTAKIVTGRFSGNTVLIPRMDLTSSDKNIPFVLKRRQFPVKVCFALTINKAQGQTFNKVGIYLETPVFSHGQLYVAFSRARNWENVKVEIRETKKQGKLLKNSDKIFTKNIVFKNLLKF